MLSFTLYRRPASQPFTKRRLLLCAAALFAFTAGPAPSAHAGNITFTCAANINSLGPASLCNSFNTTLASLYSTTFSNANASVYIQFGNTGLGGSSQYLEAISYAGYRAALKAASSGDLVDTRATASLPSVEPSPFTGKNIILTGALGGALGVGDIVGETSSGAFCSTPGSAGCYNGVITLATPSIVAGYGDTYFYENGPQPAKSYDIFTVTEHEVDEILGTLSCGGTSAGAIVDLCGSGYAAAADLFRYNGPGSRVGYTSTPAYFSYDSGLSSVAPYNYFANGADYGDFSTGCAHVQDAFGCPGTAFNILNDGQPEVTILDALGYNLNPVATPEPSSLLLLGSALGLGTGLIKRRR